MTANASVTSSGVGAGVDSVARDRAERREPRRGRARRPAPVAAEEDPGDDTLAPAPPAKGRLDVLA